MIKPVIYSAKPVAQPSADDHHYPIIRNAADIHADNSELRQTGAEENEIVGSIRLAMRGMAQQTEERGEKVWNLFANHMPD